MRVVCYHSEPRLPTTYRLVQARTIGKRVLRACGSGADLTGEWRHKAGRSHVDDRLVSARMPAGEVDGDAALLVGLSDVDACSSTAARAVSEREKGHGVAVAVAVAVAAQETRTSTLVLTR